MADDMTLRDRFAMTVLTGLILLPDYQRASESDIAGVAYKQADAMLAERAKTDAGATPGAVEAEHACSKVGAALLVRVALLELVATEARVFRAAGFALDAAFVKLDEGGQ